MPKDGRIRVHGHGEVEVERIVDLLTDFRHAYNSILLFEHAVDFLDRTHRELGRYPYWEGLAFSLPRRWSRLTREWPPKPAEVASYVGPTDQLVLAGVTLHSPGFWDFIGKLNPLEVMRQYLNDRHERRKDREYRESAEARKLRLENLKLENEVIGGRIQLAMQMGATERDLAPLLNELVFRPLGGLDRHQDGGTIDNAEVRRLPDRSTDSDLQG